MKQNNTLSLRLAMLPIIALVLLLSLNVSIYGDDALGGSNQFILLLGGAVAAIVGFGQKIRYKDMLLQVAENLKSVTGAILILLFSKLHRCFCTLQCLNLTFVFQLVGLVYIDVYCTPL